MKRTCILLLFISLVSCVVSKKAFDQTLADKVRLEAELMEHKTQLEQTNTGLTNANNMLAKMKKDSAVLMSEYEAAEKNLLDLKKEHDRLRGNYKSLTSSSGELNKNLDAQKKQLLALQTNLERTQVKNDSLNSSLAVREKKVKELEAILAEEGSTLKDLKLKISNALLNFKENDLTVTQKDGKVYVSLAEQLLFEPGKIEIDKKGQTALQQLSKALKDQTDISIMVEGHTDIDPITKPSAYMNDNWDLSVERATNITRILTKEGVRPKQITAAGRGEYSPLVPNTSAQNKRLNRRTEIIITPNLSELYSILNKRKE